MLDDKLIFLSLFVQMMEIAEEEHEQDVVTSSSSPNTVVDILDSKFFLYSLFKSHWFFTLEYLEKSENERVLTPELEQVLIQIAKTGYSR